MFPLPKHNFICMKCSRALYHIMPNSHEDFSPMPSQPLLFRQLLLFYCWLWSSWFPQQFCSSIVPLMFSKWLHSTLSIQFFYSKFVRPWSIYSLISKFVRPRSIYSLISEFVWPNGLDSDLITSVSKVIGFVLILLIKIWNHSYIFTLLRELIDDF